MTASRTAPFDPHERETMFTELRQWLIRNGQRGGSSASVRWPWLWWFVASFMSFAFGDWLMIPILAP
jgi:hypothetical protein